ncbi:hypothetical protein ABZ747_17535 [Kitasatospora cineracea]
MTRAGSPRPRDGRPDLSAVTADRHLLTYRGTTAPADRGAPA